MTPVQRAPNPQPSQAVLVSELREQLIRACLRYQFMTVVDCCQWLRALRGRCPTRNHVGKVVSGLAQDEYLHAFALPKTRSGAATKVYVPGEASRALLTLWGDEEGMTWNSPASMQNYSYSYVYHNLAVSRLAICAALFCREHQSYALAELRLWYELAGSNRPRVRLETEGQVTETSVIPDVFVFLQRLTDGGGPGIWWEADNGTTYRVAFLRRLQARLAYLTSADYEREFGTPAVNLCYVVITKDPKRRAARLQSLARWIDDYLVQEEQESWASMFRLIAVEYETLYEHTTAFFTEKLWYPPGKIGSDTAPSLSLLPPPNETENTHANTTTPPQQTYAHP